MTVMDPRIRPRNLMVHDILGLPRGQRSELGVPRAPRCAPLPREGLVLRLVFSWSVVASAWLHLVNAGDSDRGSVG